MDLSSSGFRAGGMEIQFQASGLYQGSDFCTWPGVFGDLQGIEDYEGILGPCWASCVILRTPFS